MSEESTETCQFSNFMDSLKPWLNDDYVQKVYTNQFGNFVLLFKDGIRKTFYIDDCTDAIMDEIISYLKKNGIEVAA